MLETNHGLTRRSFLKTAIGAVGATTLPLGHISAQTSAKYTRYNVTSSGGKKALVSYAKGIEAMLKLPADHPQNWFRNTFIHLMDCPHGNWWFYVWHRAYLGYFEQTIRNLSGDKTFAIPYWDWTTLPQIPDAMFEGVLTPDGAAFEPYTRNLAVFTSFLRPVMTSYWEGLSFDQVAQLKARGYRSFDNVWNDVTGYDPTQAKPHGVSGNVAYANPCGSRYLTRDNPKLDDKTAYDVSPFVVYSGLLPTDFYNADSSSSFNSSKAPSHNMPAGGPTSFSVLEGLSHNKVHNYIGGVRPLDPGPYGYMTNFLSSTDPIFYLHHSNMDRLWDVWTRKQKRLNLPYLPTDQDLELFSKEPFLFFVDGNGKYVVSGKAGDYLDTEKFEYEYEPGFGEDVVQPPSPELKAKNTVAAFKSAIEGNVASFAVPSDLIKNHLSAAINPSLFAEITLPRPNSLSVTREFDVVVGAPADLSKVGVNSPYYAGTLAFFGSMTNMEGMSGDATFSIPLPKSPQAFQGLEATQKVPLSIRILPSQGQDPKAPAIKAAVVRAV